MAGRQNGAGFLQKDQRRKGQVSDISAGFKTLEYVPSEKVKFATLEGTKAIGDVSKRFAVLVAGKIKQGNFIEKHSQTSSGTPQCAFLKSPTKFSGSIRPLPQVLAGNMAFLKPGMRLALRKHADHYGKPGTETSGVGI
jgi:hypothetical protein